MESTQSVGLVGSWKNAYGSLMKIYTQDSSGLLSGVYTSTTGASGTYALIGFAPKGLTGNYPVSLSIYWRSLEKGPSNPTWNWVSQLSGQVLTDTDSGTPELELLHGMVASTSYPDVGVSEPGIYTETLVFTPYQASTQALEEATHPLPANTSLNGNWTNKNSASPYKSLGLMVDNQANVTGVLESNTGSFAVAGLYDSSATSDMLMSVSISGMVADGINSNPTVSFGGFLDPSSNELTLLTYKSHATSYANKYACVSVIGTEVFTQS